MSLFFCPCPTSKAGPELRSGLPALPRMAPFPDSWVSRVGPPAAIAPHTRGFGLKQTEDLAAPRPAEGPKANQPPGLPPKSHSTPQGLGAEQNPVIYPDLPPMPQEEKGNKKQKQKHCKLDSLRVLGQNQAYVWLNSRNHFVSNF